MPARYQFADIFNKAVFRPWSTMLDGMLEVVTHDYYPLKNTQIGRLQAASLESASRLLSHYPKPETRNPILLLPKQKSMVIRCR